MENKTSENSQDLSAEQTQAVSAEQQSSSAAKELEEWKKKSESYWDQLLRLQAEFSNYRARTEKEKQDAVRYGKEYFVEKLLGTLDILEHAARQAEESKDIESIKIGIRMLTNEFHRFLKSEGLEAIPSIGETFDPHLHDAVDQVETEEEKNHNRIVAELQKGYTFAGKLLRPARVNVGKLKKIS